MAANAEVKRIIEVSTGQSAKSLRELRQAVEDAKASLKDAQAGSAEYEEALVKVKAAQSNYNSEMRISVKENEAAKGSYNDLVNQLARLKEAWKQAAPGTDEYKKLTNAVNEVKTKLEDADHDIGNWQRNVGNYGGKLKTMFTDVAGGTGTVAKGVFNMGKAFKAVAANPFFIVIGGLFYVLEQISKAFNSNEQNARAVTAAMVPLASVTDLAKVAFEKLAQGIAWVAQKMSELLSSWFPQLKETMEAHKLIAEMEAEIQDTYRENLRKNADEELEIAKLREKAVDKENYSAEERLEALEEANKKELAMAERKKDLAKQEYELEVLRAEQSGNSAEENDKLAELYAKMVGAETEYFNKSRALIKETNRVRKEARKEELESATASIKAEKEKWEERLKHVHKGSNEEYNAMLQFEDARYLLERETARLSIQNAEDRVNALRAIDDAHNDRLAEVADIYVDRQIERQKTNLEREILAAEDNAMALLDAKIRLKQLEIDTLTQMETESDEEYLLRQEKLNKELEDLQAESIETKIAFVQQYVDAISSLASGIAEAWKSEVDAQVQAGKMSQEEAEKQYEGIKSVQIAVATVQMLTGMVTAFSGAFTNKMSIADWILAGIQAATIATTGIMNIMKIKNTKVGGGTSTASSAKVSTTAPTVNTQIPQTRVVTNAEDEQRINNMQKNQKVYLVYSDLEAAGNKVDVRNAESSF